MNWNQISTQDYIKAVTAAEARQGHQVEAQKIMEQWKTIEEESEALLFQTTEAARLQLEAHKAEIQALRQEYTNHLKQAYHHRCQYTAMSLQALSYVISLFRSTRLPLR